MRAIAILVAGILLPAGSALAANGNGEFYSRGLGIATCQNYLDDKAANSERYLYYRSWLNGYLTAYNQLTRDTFDITPDISIDRLAEAMARFCASNRDRPFWVAAIALTRSLEAQRQPTKPQLPIMSADGRSMTIDREPPRRVQARLKARGYGVGVVDGLYGRNTRQALKAFQKDQQLAVTGLPDAQAQARLFQ